MLLSALYVLAAATLVTSQQSGACPDVPAVLNFNATAMSGVWYDQVHTKRGTGLELRCDLVKFAAPSPASLSFSTFTYSSATKKIISVSGDAEVLSSGKLKVNIPSLQLHGEVRVLSTDYTTFAVLWACGGSSSHAERSLVLTRDKQASSSLLQAALRVLDNHHLPRGELSFTSHHKCHDYDLNGQGLSNSLGSATSMGSLLAVHAASAPVSTTSTTTTASTTSAASTTTQTSRVANLANKAQKVWSSITG